MELWLIWLIAGVLFGIIEILTLSLLSLWFAVGSLAAMVLALLGIPFKAQMVIFIIVSVGFLISTRPLVSKFVRTERVKTGTELLIGKTALVIVPVDNINGIGLVKVGGEEWSAVSANDSVIPANCHVKIIEVRGVRLVVEKLD